MCRYVHYSAVHHCEKINNNCASYCISGEYATEISIRLVVKNCISFIRDGHAPVFASGNRVIFRKNAPVCTKNLIYIMRIRSQSGQIQVGPLLIPHLFSSKQSLQIMNPQGQLQQNCCFCLQQWQIYVPIFLFLYPSLSFFIDMAALLHKSIGNIHYWNC
jgi:hypothetical protein